MGDDNIDYADAGRKAWQQLADMKLAIDNDGTSHWTVQKTEEEILREQYPTLQDAWDKYQSILKLCKTKDGN